MENIEEMSLLWTTPMDSYFQLENKTVDDLNMISVFDDLSPTITEDIMTLLQKVPTQINTIRYRQDIMKDFIENELLLDAMKVNMEKSSAIKNLIKFAFESESNMYNLLSRLDEVWEVMSITEGLHQVLANAHLHSEGLKNIQSLLYDAIHSDTYQDFKDDVSQIRSMDEGIRCVKIGINLDDYLKPKEVIFLSVEEEAFKYTRKMKKTGKIIKIGFSQIKAIPRKIFAPDSLALPDALNNLELVIAPTMKALIDFCDVFNNILLEVYEPILKELTFYDIGFRIYRKVTEQNLVLCQPKLSEVGDTKIEGLYNLNLAYNLMAKNGIREMVDNDFGMTHGNLFILTGANRGGKTTFTQSIGQIYWLAQLGYYVPARAAHMKLIDGLFTHFPTTEVETIYNGRLGEECERFSAIFSKMSSRGLLLMNESFDGTSHTESLMIAMDTLRAIGHLGACVIFNTHLHELGKRIQELNEGLTKARAISLVTNLYHQQEAFKVIEGIPEGKSFARDIAVKYGVSYEQLVKA